MNKFTEGLDEATREQEAAQPPNGNIVYDKTGRPLPPRREKRVEYVDKPAINPTTEGVWIGNVCVTSTGLVFGDAFTEKEWRDFYPAVKELKTAGNWVLGDYFAWGEYLFDLTYDQMAEITGLKSETIEVYASICRNVRKLIRINSLSFAHHRLVAAMPEPEQIDWLQKAVEGGWSVREMRRQITGESDDTPALADKKNRKVMNEIWRAVEQGRAVNREQIQHVRRWLDEVERGLR